MWERTHGRGPGTWALIALGAAVLLMLLGWIVAAVVGPGGHAGYGWGMMPWGGMMGAALPVMLMMWLAMLLFWAAVVLGLVALVRWAAGLPWGHRAEESDALEVARRRYARGEITREECQRLRDELGQPPRRTRQTDTTGS